jgi:hypothetical protein
MIGLFTIGVILWIIGSLMEKREMAERRRRLYHPEVPGQEAARGLPIGKPGPPLPPPAE